MQDNLDLFNHTLNDSIIDVPPVGLSNTCVVEYNPTREDADLAIYLLKEMAPVFITELDDTKNPVFLSEFFVENDTLKCKVTAFYSVYHEREKYTDLPLGHSLVLVSKDWFYSKKCWIKYCSIQKKFDMFIEYYGDYRQIFSVNLQQPIGSIIFTIREI